MAGIVQEYILHTINVLWSHFWTQKYYNIILLILKGTYFRENTIIVYYLHVISALSITLHPYTPHTPYYRRGRH